MRNSRFTRNSDLTKAYPQTADQIFDKHWRTWFTETDVQRLKELGINTVRIPVSVLPRTISGFHAHCTSKLGYWLVEPLVEEGEFYPKGGMRRLVRLCTPFDFPGCSDRLQKEGLGWLKDAGIAAILDHHALPGVAAENQMFAGR